VATIFTKLKRHLTIDAILIAICLICIVAVQNHYEGQKIFDYSFLIYLICYLLLILHQLWALMSRFSEFASLFILMGILYFLAGFVGAGEFVVRTFAW
jgi:hypothetical protein